MDKKSVREEMSKFLDDVEKKEIETVKIPKEKIKEEKQKHAEYFQGEIQLRNVDKKIVEKVVNKIHQEKENIPQFLELNKTDFNLKCSSKKLIQKIGRELQKIYGGEFRQSAKLCTNKDGKDLYRVNVFYKKPGFEIGDIVISENKLYKIKSFLRERINAVNLETNNLAKLKENDIEKKIKKVKAEIVTTTPQVTILDENFQPVELVNAKEDIKIGQKEKIVIFKGKAYLT